jgi:hypothetical protein
VRETSQTLVINPFSRSILKPRQQSSDRQASTATLPTQSQNGRTKTNGRQNLAPCRPNLGARAGFLLIENILIQAPWPTAAVCVRRGVAMGYAVMRRCWPPPPRPRRRRGRTVTILAAIDAASPSRSPRSWRISSLLFIQIPLFSSPPQIRGKNLARIRQLIFD